MYCWVPGLYTVEYLDYVLSNTPEDIVHVPLSKVQHNTVHSIRFFTPWLDGTIN